MAELQRDRRFVGHSLQKRSKVRSVPCPRRIKLVITILAKHVKIHVQRDVPRPAKPVAHKCPRALKPHLLGIEQSNHHIMLGRIGNEMISHSERARNTRSIVISAIEDRPIPRADMIVMGRHHHDRSFGRPINAGDQVKTVERFASAVFKSEPVLGDCEPARGQFCRQIIACFDIAFGAGLPSAHVIG